VGDLTADVVVVGAGIAGLAAGCDLAREGLEVLVCEAASRPGGVIESVRRDGYLLERGPNTFRVSAPFASLLERHAAGDRLVGAAPTSRERFLLRDGRLLPVPLGPLGLVTTPLLSPRGKLRLLGEPFVARGDASGESVADFVTRRLGREVCESMVGPFLVGVYAGDERRLGAESVFPSLVAFERSHGSIVRGAVASAFRRREEAARPGIFSGSEGAAAVVEPLATALGSRLLLDTRVHGLSRDGDGWRLELSGPEGSAVVAARGLVLATQAPHGAELLAPVDADASCLLSQIEYAPVATVALGVDPAQASQAVRGFGFLVPGRSSEPLLGCLFMSQLFPGRAPEGRELLACMLGGLRRPEIVEETEEELARRASEAVTRLLGLRGEVRPLGVTRWPRAVPQPDPEHPRRMRAVRDRLAALPPLALAGAYVAGVSVPDSAVSGASAAVELSRRLRS
jgi:oxygen-dependent protoporphyrinogen oxidase